MLSVYIIHQSCWNKIFSANQVLKYLTAMLLCSFIKLKLPSADSAACMKMSYEARDTLLTCLCTCYFNQTND